MPASAINLKDTTLIGETTRQWDDPVFDPNSEPGRVLEQELQQVLNGIAAAADTDGLLQAARQIQALVHRLVEQANEAEPMTLLISMLNDVLTRRVIEIVSAGVELDGIRWCWISLGSEGRQEQTLSSDQDNGMIFTGEVPAEELRKKLLPLAQRINAVLDACGFPFCTGQVMAGNPEWCLSLSEWKERFRNWIIEGDPQALLNASIFFDLRPLHGAQDLAEELGAWLAKEASANRRFLFQMAANSLRREAPLGLLRKFVVEKGGKYPGTIDLKVNAATMFVDGARIYGLTSGTHASNTAERFRLAIGAHRLHAGDVEKWIDAFYFIQRLRLKNQQRSYNLGQEMHNHIDPKQLDPADRDKLHNALRQARALQKRLALDYPGSHSI
jgi:CBS domain-containing protein